jgi:type II secretory pathway pseudopilin PulG
MPTDIRKQAFGAHALAAARIPRWPHACFVPVRRAENGFTLVETLVTMVAALLVLGATVTLLSSSQGIQARDSEWALIMQQNRVGLSRMVHDIRQASEVKEAGAGAIKFVGTIGGKELEIKYQCNTAQTGTSYTECVRLAAEKGKALPTSGPAVATDLLNGASVFTYTPSAAAPRAVIVKLEVPAKGTLKQAISSGLTHKVVLEDAAFMREAYREG